MEMRSSGWSGLWAWAIGVGAAFSNLQHAGLAHPVLPVNPAAEAPQLACHAVDIVLAHFGNLPETVKAQSVQCFFDGRANTLDLLQIVPGCCRFAGAIP